MPFESFPKRWPAGFLNPDYTWEDEGAGIVVRVDGDAYYAQTTSTSTVVLRSKGPPGAFLRMYLPGHGVMVLHAAGTRGFPLACSRNVELANLPKGRPGIAHITYLDSTVAPGRAEGAPGSAFSFDRSLGAQDEVVLQATAVPHAVGKRTLDGKADQYSVFKDVHVLPVAGTAWGDGWLMLAVRQSSSALLGPGQGEGADRAATAVIVGLWSPDPGFSTTVRGPFLLAATDGDYESIDLGDPTGDPVRSRGWLGVPSGAVLRDSESNEEWLYVYYLAEPANGHPEFRPGTYARRIRTSALPWNADGACVQVSDGGVTTVIRWEDACRESQWNTATGYLMLAGEALGKVRLWTSVDGSARWWGKGEDPAGSRNVLFWALSPHAKDVDAAVVAFDGGVNLYVSINQRTAEGHERSIYGIWRTTAGPATVGRVAYMDFAFRWADVLTEDGTYDLVARSAGSASTSDVSVTRMRLDPDPVQLPSGEWIVFTGGADTNNGNPDVLGRFSTSAANGSRRFRSIWRV